MGTVSLPLSIMKFLTIVTCFGLAVGSTVKREAEPEAEAQFGFGIHEHRAYSSAPECTFTPVKDCKTRDVERPKKICQTVVDKHEDTVVTEECEETVTTVCTQTSSTTQHRSKVVDSSSKLVEEGSPKPITEISHGYSRHVKREAEPVAEADPGFIQRYSGDSVHSVPIRNLSPPDCKSTPVKNCENKPRTSNRVVSRVVCDTVVDVTQIEDCTETITKSCTSARTYQSSRSRVVGGETKIVGGSGIESL